jgi:hypothetical protein
MRGQRANEEFRVSTFQIGFSLGISLLRENFA